MKTILSAIRGAFTFKPFDPNSLLDFSKLPGEARTGAVTSEDRAETQSFPRGLGWM